MNATLSAPTSIEPRSKRRTIGHVLAGFVTFAMIASAAGKLAGAQPVLESLAKSHLENYVRPIGVLELTIALLFAIPRTSSLGVMLVTGYFGGAVVAHLAAADPGGVVPALVLGALAWGANSLRNPQMFESMLRR
jgi:hypothetical protein